MINLRLTGQTKTMRLGESGQALVEAAIAAPIFFLLLMGSAELARVAYSSIEIQNAAEAGALYAIETQGSMKDTTGITAAAKADAANLSGVTVSTTKSYYCSDGSTPDSSISPPTCDTGVTETSIHVTTSVSFDPLVHIPGLASKFTLNGFAAARCESCL